MISGIITLSMILTGFVFFAGEEAVRAAPITAPTPHYFGPWPNYANSPLPTSAITSVTVDSGGAFYIAPTVAINDLYGLGSGALATANVTGGVITGIQVTNPGSGYSAPKVVITDATGSGAAATAVISGQVTGGIRKFIDSLPQVGPSGANNLGQYLSIASPDNATYPGCDYYEIGLVQYTEKMHTDLPATLLLGYVQLSTAIVPGLQIPLTYINGTPILDPYGNQVYAVDNPHYLGTSIVAQRDRPVRIKFTNYLPTGMGGDLFLPVDTTVMGAGMGPLDMMGMPGMKENYTQNRGTLHLHGGATPWISDGTPHQWTTPAGEMTQYPKGVSVEYVPDMWFVNGTVIPNTIGQTTPPVPGASNNPGDGSLTFYYTNQQSARLMFYHDHAYGITRLNVYAGEAAGYILTDQVEQDLIVGTDVSGVNPGHLQILPDIGIPLIIQDKTYVDNTTIGYQDPTWVWGSTPGTAHTGNLWLPHVYMPNQNAYSIDGSNGFGRWDYGPWFWPPTSNIANGPIPNPYYDPNNPNNPQEPPMIPAAPNPSQAMEAFMDTPTVNGVAYPYLVVEPKAYRFRILSIGNDRTLDLQWYKADPSVTTWDGRTNTEVAMVPASSGCPCNPVFPPSWPNDGRAGGVPDPRTVGPEFIQIGTEGGFLPAPVVIPNQPITWNLNAKTFNYGNVLDHSLLLGPAERADVIVDFSAYAGQTLILYNDGSAAFPAYDPRYDYFTGDPDNTDSGGAPTTQPGYGPNTRTIMQVRVMNTTAAAPYDLAALNAVFAKNATKRGVFEVSQDPIIVPQAGYDSAYDKSFPVDTFVRIGDMSKTFQTISGNTLTIPFTEKAIHDEMGAAFDEYGRASGFLGLEIPNTQAQTQNFLLYGYASPPVDITVDSVTASEPVAGDGTQIWRITHNGIDTHAIHFHLFNVQVINRVGWDNMVLPPDPNELGWKETVRMNPLESCIVALRPIAPTLPFEVPNSIRLIDPTVPEGTVLSGGPWGFTDPSSEPVTVINHKVNFGWEYVYHCHLLGHEEMDMMHAVPFAVAPKAPTNLVGVLLSPTSTKLTWQDNSISETNYVVQRAQDPNFTVSFVENVLDADVTSYVDTISSGVQYYYRVTARNIVGDTAVYAAPSIGFPTKTMDSAFTNVVSLSYFNPTITTTTLPPGEISIPYSKTLSVSGGVAPFTWSRTAGNLPNGITLNSTTGTLSGTPTQFGTFSFTVRVTDGFGSIATKALSLLIVRTPRIITNNLPDGRVGLAYSATLSADRGVPPFTWSLAAGTLPTGLTLSTLNPTQGIIRGTPTAAGRYTFTVRVTDSLGGTSTQALAITIRQ